jgi:hypothetical protein
MALDVGLGWVAGDDVRVLVAAGLTVGVYQVTQIQADMNYLGTEIDGFVASVQALLTRYDTIQAALISLNNTSGGKVLVKADVLEWEPSSPGDTYGPERELMQIMYQLRQYFASSSLFSGMNTTGSTVLLRS